jgi:hypothetical protein
VKFAVGVRLRRQRKSRRFRLEDDLSVSHRTMLGIVHKASHSPENRHTLKSKQPAIKKTRQEDTTCAYTPPHFLLILFELSKSSERDNRVVLPSILGCA